jgi:hypothetical protein
MDDVTTLASVVRPAPADPAPDSPPAPPAPPAPSAAFVAAAALAPGILAAGWPGDAVAASDAGNLPPGAAGPDPGATADTQPSGMAPDKAGAGGSQGRPVPDVPGGTGTPDGAAGGGGTAGGGMAGGAVPGPAGRVPRRWSRRGAYAAVAAAVVALVSLATGISLLGSSGSPPASAGTRPEAAPGSAGQVSPAAGQRPGSAGGTSRAARGTSGSRPGRDRGTASSGVASPSPSVVSLPGSPATSAAVTITLCTQPTAGCTAVNAAATMQVAPAEIDLTVSGAADHVTGITWSDWGSSQATGTGTLVKSSCLLSCSVPVTITAGSPRAYATGEAAYATLSLTASGTLGLLTTIVSGLVP